MNPTMENVLVTANSRRTIESWDIAACTGRVLIKLDTASATRICWQISDPNTLLIGGTDGLLRVADVRSQIPVHTIMAPKSREIRDCQFNPHDNCTLAACFDNGTVQTFDCRQPRQCARRMIVHDGGALCLAYHPTRRGILATGGASSGLVSYQAQQAFKLKIIAPDRDAFTIKAIRVSGVNALCWRKNTNEIASSLDSKFSHDMLMWNYEDPYFTPSARFSGHLKPVTRFAFISCKSEDDHLVSVGKDGRICLQRYREMFLPRQGRAFCWSHSAFVVSDDPVQPSSKNRGKATATVISGLPNVINKSDEDSTLVHLTKSYKFNLSSGPTALMDLRALCEWNAQAAKDAGSEYAAGFWRTLDCWFTLDENGRLMKIDSVAAGASLSSVPSSPSSLEIRSPPNQRRSSSGLYQPPPLRIAPTPTSTTPSTTTTTTTPLMPRKGEDGISGSGVSGELSRKGLLKELRLLDPSVSRMFQVRTKLPSFRQAMNDLSFAVAETTNVDPRSDEPHVLMISVENGGGGGGLRRMDSSTLSGGRRQSSDHLLPSAATTTTTTTRPGGFNKNVSDRIECVGKALDFLVDSVGDVLTAVVCVLIFRSLNLPLPASLSKIKRWIVALCELLERKELFSQALELGREVNAVLKMKDDIPESRVGMACGRCNEPLPSMGLKGECPACTAVVAKCSICRRVVRGIYVTCLYCGHGGHLDHMQEWFNENQVCPRGCECECKFAL